MADSVVLHIYMYVMVFLYGILIGSFLNVVICRVPRGESFVKVRSHCEGCGYQLKWYDLIPLFSYLFLGGKCRKCKVKISIQHPIIEGVNGILYCVVFWKFGMSVETLIYCLVFSALLALSVIDFRTYEIPRGFEYVIGTLAILYTIWDYQNWLSHVIGFFAVSAMLYALYYISNGAWIGGGDVQLMAVCGLLLGWKLIIAAFLAGCILGSLIHLVRMKLSGENHLLALGPYLSAGVMLMAMWGEEFLQWYLHTLGLGM